MGVELNSVKTSLLVALAATALLTSEPGWTQPYPTKPIRLVVSYSAGGATDLLGRTLAKHWTAPLGQQVIVENRPGAGGNIGAAAVARAAPDGYTLLFASFALPVSVTLYPKLPFDVMRDLAPITQVANTPFLMVVHPSLPVKNVKELISLARARPNQLTFASAGSGSTAHLSGELLNTMAGIQLVHVPYKGAAPATVDVLSGQVTMSFVNILQTLPLVQTGKLRSLGVTTAKRSQVAPDIPSIAESGVPGFDVMTWFGVLATGGTPQTVISLLHGQTVKILQQPDVRATLLASGVEPVGSTPEEFRVFLKSEIDKWGEVVRRARVQPE